MTKLCAIVRTSEAVRVCEVTQYPIYDYRHLMPMMEVRAFEGRPLNAVNRLIVPVTGQFTLVASECSAAHGQSQS